MGIGDLEVLSPPAETSPLRMALDNFHDASNNLTAHFLVWADLPPTKRPPCYFKNEAIQQACRAFDGVAQLVVNDSWSEEERWHILTTIFMDDVVQRYDKFTKVASDIELLDPTSTELEIYEKASNERSEKEFFAQELFNRLASDCRQFQDVVGCQAARTELKMRPMLLTVAALGIVSVGLAWVEYRHDNPR